MAGKSMDDLLAFLEVAQELSFTRAAAKIGVSPCRISWIGDHPVSSVEDHLIS
jgi:hypothetical protein